MKIYFINSKEKSCGVYQYGLRIWNILKKSDLEIFYHEINSSEEFLKLNFENIDLIFFNFIEGGPNGPFGWYNTSVMDHVSSVLKIKTASILHTTTPTDIKFDFLIDQDPVNGFPRPLYDFCKTKNTKTTDSIKVCSFGFTNTNKGFDDVVRLVNDQYDNAEINLHLTSSFYGHNASYEKNLVIDQLNKITLKPNVKLNITDSFISNEDLLEFISNNDIVLFGYRYGQHISSATDYPISANIPIGLTNMEQFVHIYKPEIDIHLNKISDILDFNIKNNYVGSFKEKWSSENLILAFKKFLNKIKQ